MIGWLCRLLRCERTQRERTHKQVQKEQEMDDASSRISEHAHHIENAFIDINIQKNALEAFARDLHRWNSSRT